MSLEFVDIRHAYGDAVALEDIRFSAAPGEITCLLGPSGCGKSTLLRLAAGILELQSGEIRLDGDILADRKSTPPPEARPVGLVFQEGALFPHMTVARNIGFGVADNGDRKKIVSDLLQRIGLSSLADRYPHTLSGGQQQRVALARALAPRPKVLLLDEPFASVDVVRRRALREEARRMLKDQNAIAIIVTHDPEEAMEVADRIVVMETRRIVQIGAPEELYDAPATASVGALIGEGQTVEGRREGDALRTPFGVWDAAALKNAADDAPALDLLIRPDIVDLDPNGAGGVVEDIRRTGRAQRVAVVAPSGERLMVDAPREQALSIGEAVGVTPHRGAVFAFPARKP